METDGELDDWLTRSGLAELAPTLREHSIDSIDLLAGLTDADYREMGVRIGMRKRIRNAIEGRSTPRAGHVVGGSDERGAEPERRQLTVLFCDVVDSTPLSRRLDPEDLAELYRRYTDRCIDVMERFEGHVERFVGDAVLGYFGFPQAHEDDAARAILAGLEMVKDIEDLATESGVALAIRVGVATGVVVVGELYSNVNGRVNEVIGDTTNLASRVQGATPPGTVVVTEPTRRLAGEMFEYAGLGPHQLKGIDEPVSLYTVLREKRAAVRFQQRQQTGPAPFPGRAREMDQLMAAWRAALEGSATPAHIVGEAGYGKSKLAYELVNQVAPPQVVTIQCSNLHRSSPLYPVIGALRVEAGVEHADSVDSVTARLAEFVASTLPSRNDPALVTQMSSLVLTDALSQPEMTPRQLRAQTMDVLTAYLLDRRQPTLVLLEDAHWADPSTLELVDSVVRRVQDRPVMVLSTSRPEFTPTWATGPAAVTVSVGALDAESSAVIARGVPGAERLPGFLIAAVVDKAAGVPLFVEELTRSVAESLAAGAVDVAAIEVPSTLADSLLARLDRLGSARRVTQMAAAIGQEFDRALLAHVADMDGPPLDHQLGRLIEAGIVVQLATNDAFAFRHALVRDVAYQTMLRARRRDIHWRIADALLIVHRDDDRLHPEVRAQQLTLAGRIDEGIAAWTAAGGRAAERSATLEAIAHYDHALALVQELPASAEAQRTELVLQVRRAGMLRVSRGFGAPETGAAFERARELCLALGDQEQIIPTLSGLYSYHLQHDYREAGLVAEQLLRVAEEHGSTSDLMIGRRAVGVVAFHVGDPATAISELREALALYDSDTHAADAFVYGTDHASTAAAFLAISLWLDGRGGEALAQAQWAVDQGDRLSHLPSTAQALIYQCFIGVMERRHDVAEPVAARLIDLAGRIGFTLLVAAGRFLRAASAAHGGQAAEVIDEMYVSLEDWKATNSHSYLPFACACLATACAALGRHDEGLARVDEGLVLAERSGETWCAAELHRVRALLLQDAGAEDDAIVAALRTAIDIARRQGVITFDLRASCALAEHHASRGRMVEALAVLGEVPPHASANGHDVEAERQLIASFSGTNGSTTPS